jgi:hypothetical protein
MDQNIELHIDELVLHGFSASDAPYIKAAIEQRLSQLFTSQGIPSTLSIAGEINRMNAGTFNTMAGSAAETTGSQIAETIYNGFTK